jgi:gluconolactonase
VRLPICFKANFTTTNELTRSTNPRDGIFITQYHPDFAGIVGERPSPRHALLLSTLENSKNAFFHKSCGFLSDLNELYTTSKPLQATESSRLPVVLISKVNIRRNVSTNEIEAAEWAKLRAPASMTMPAGGTAYRNGILYCSQGTMAPKTGGLFYMPYGRPPEPIVTSYYGRDFNSLQGVAVSKNDGTIWFTDSACGFDQDIRGTPQLPSQVYRFNQKTGSIRAMADGFGRPSAVAFSPSGTTVYVSDAEAIKENGDKDPFR